MQWLSPVRAATTETDSMAMVVLTLAGLSRLSYAELSRLRPAPDAFQNAILKYVAMDLLTDRRNATTAIPTPVMVAHPSAR
jgi:hypothetical protein